jgi:periplasmic divalent cation tolerance protein
VPDIVQIVTTVASREAADRLATTMVEGRLAACVQIHGPIESVYRWQNQLRHSTEWQCTFKTTKHGAASLRTRLLSEHPYDVPELLILPAETDAAYAEWVESETRHRGPEFNPQLPGGNSE